MRRKNRVKIICEICGKEFEVVYSKRNKARFCSSKCWGISLKGKPNGRKGIKMPPSFGERIRKEKTGKKLSEEHSKKLKKIILRVGKKTRFTSERVKEMWENPEYKKEVSQKISKALKGKPKSEKHKENLSISRIQKKLAEKENNPNWRNGSSFEPYTPEFDKKLREQIRTRDNWICQLCKIQQKELRSYHKVLDVHHIDYDKKNCQEYNLISLCKNCHSKVNYKREYWLEYFQKIIKIKLVIKICQVIHNKT